MVRDIGDADYRKDVLDNQILRCQKNYVPRQLVSDVDAPKAYPGSRKYDYIEVVDINVADLAVHYSCSKDSQGVVPFRRKACTMLAFLVAFVDNGDNVVQL